MEVLFGLSLGKILFLSGVGILILAMVLNIIFVVTSKSRKQRLEERMKEKY